MVNKILLQTVTHPTEEDMTDSVSGTHLIIMGVSGTGKTTVATLLAKKLNWEYAEGDQLHPVQNVEKMRAEQPLTDADRWPWLNQICEWINAQNQAGINTVLTCSALKRSYRDLLRKAHGKIIFVHLYESEAVLFSRLRGRTGHFMPASLLSSQLQTLENLQPDETGILVRVNKDPKELAAEIISTLKLPISP